MSQKLLFPLLIQTNDDLYENETVVWEKWK
jgi:hypothetical protein